MKALILAAGLGRRLKIDKPKILLKIRNKTLLERHLVNLINFGVSNIGIVIGYKSNQLKKRLVQIWRYEEELAYIRSGFYQGDQLLTSRLSTLIEGMEVKILIQKDQ